jgi:hypothetical protein
MSRGKINKLLILEGLHGVGKSTLAASLAGEPRTATFHFNAPMGSDPYYEYLRPIVWLADWSVVLDRSHLGEVVWPTIFGRTPLYGERALPQLETAIQEAASVVEVWVLCGPSPLIPSKDNPVRNASRARGLTDEEVDFAWHLFTEEIPNRTTFPCHLLTWDELPKEVTRWKSL